MTARRPILVGTAVVGAALVVVLVVMLGTGGGTEAPDPSPTTTGPTPSTGFVAAGLELTGSGEVRLHAPSCPGTVVTDVRWIGFPDLGTAIWTIKLVDDLDTTPSTFTVGDRPAGYETDVALTTPPTDLLAQDRDTSFVLLREDLDGASQPYAAANARLDELRQGMIRYDPDGPAPARFVASVEEYESAVGCG